MFANIYKITKKFPKEEQYGLISQIRRAAASVPSKISEGYGRKTTPDCLRSLCIAYGSNCELETQIMLSRDLDYIFSNDSEKLLNEIRDVERMLKALIKSPENKCLTSGR